MRRLYSAALLLLLCLFLFDGTAFAQDSVATGAGSYSTQRPKHCKPLPDTMYKSAILNGAMPTNQWWSSLVFTKFSQPLFAHPLALRCTQSGVNFSYPGAGLKGAAAGIFGSNSKDGDFQLAHSGAASFPSADCDGFSDWFVRAAFVSGGASLKASFGHGSPFVFCEFAGGNPVLNFKTTPNVWSGGDKDAVLAFTVGGNHYAAFAPTGSTWTGLGSKVLSTNLNGKNYLTLALLPDNALQTLALFKKYAYNSVSDTRVEFTVENGVVKSTYAFTTRALEGAAQGTLFALYPHQWRYTKSPLTAATYNSVRGTMKLGEGDRFVTEVPVQGLLPVLPIDGVSDKARLLGYLSAEADKKPANIGDTYWEGKHLGRLATLSGIAEVCGDSALQRQFTDELKHRLENWFTASPGEEKGLFYYNAMWGTLVGSPASYGSDTTLNDHHFHYGYFVRAAAEVARQDPAWAKKWGPMLELIVRDIASIDRKDPLFPHLRCFDCYAGHSWASGNADFADGNNQESSSESLNAWYGIALWGEATGNTALRDAGLFLFNTERTAVEEYWFDVSQTNFPKDHPNVALGMIWGGKGAFGTWFSGDIDCIHGINWLPFTPASLYMGRNPGYVKRNFDRIIEKRKGGADFNTGWGDLVAMFGALNDPAPALKHLDANPNCKLEGGNTHAFMYQWIQTLNTLGRNDAGLTADYPFHSVFRKDGKNTYVVHNFSGSPRTVTFSDGMKVSAEKKGVTTVRK